VQNVTKYGRKDEIYIKDKLKIIQDGSKLKKKKKYTEFITALQYCCAFCDRNKFQIKWLCMVSMLEVVTNQ
jgi:hypothetical protein